MISTNKYARILNHRKSKNFINNKAHIYSDAGWFSIYNWDWWVITSGMNGINYDINTYLGI